MKPNRKPRRSKKVLVVKCVLLAVPVLAGAILLGRSFEQARQGDGAARFRGLPFFETAEAAQPYPKTLPASMFRGFIARAYKVAEDMPGLLAQQPCYCFCKNEKHRSLLDCFTSNHAAGCKICQQEALLVQRLNREGKSAEEIRQAIIGGEWRMQPIG